MSKDGKQRRSRGHLAGCLAAALWTPGCYFFLPIQEVDANQTPVIEESDPPDGSTLLFDREVERPFVVVTDDGDELEFLWSISGIGTLGGAEPIGGTLQGSQLSLTWDESYEGRTLRVAVYDVEGASASREWIMEGLQ
jgi:hypothetical protein